MIQIYTDTAANVPTAVLKQYGVRVIPLSYTVDGETFSGVEEFDGPAFYGTMRHNADVKTSMAAPDAVRECFEQALTEGKDVLYMGLSGGVSGTYWSAHLAAEELAEKYPERRVCAIDSKAASLGVGLCVLEAAKLATEGLSFDDLVTRMEVICHNMCQYFVVDELKYLRRGGRISGMAALTGTLLQIKPILKGDDDGRIVLHTKVRGKLRALETLCDIYREKVTDPTRMVGIAHGDCPGDALRLEAKLREAGQTGEILNVCYEPVTGAHVGPGTVALFFWGNGQR